MAHQARQAHQARVDEPRWAVQPSSRTGPTGRSQFVYDLAPGEQLTDYVGVSNISAQPVTFAVYATDAFNAADGAFALLTASERPDDVGSWITLDKREYTVPAGKRMDIPFRLTVPADASPGDHAGGVIASVTVQETNKEGQRVNVDRRVAARVYLRVDGPVNPSVQITGVDVDYDPPLAMFGGADLTVTYRLRNTGNLRVTGDAVVRATGPFGMGLGRAGTVPVPELLPGSEITLHRTVEGVFPAGMVTGAITVTPTSADGAMAPVTRGASVWAVPWLLVALLLVIVAGVVLVIIRRRRARAARG